MMNTITDSGTPEVTLGLRCGTRAVQHRPMQSGQHVVYAPGDKALTVRRTAVVAGEKAAADWLAEHTAAYGSGGQALEEGMVEWQGVGFHHGPGERFSLSYRVAWRGPGLGRGTGTTLYVEMNAELEVVAITRGQGYYGLSDDDMGRWVDLGLKYLDL